MAALTAERATTERTGDLYSRPVATAVKVYAGSIVMLNATGYATPGATATGQVADGVAVETVDNTSGADGAKTVTVSKGIFKFANSASADLITIAEIGDDCYIVDDQTVAKTSGTSTRSIAGKIMAVESDGVFVKFA
jgi:hypothetical protein